MFTSFRSKILFFFIGLVALAQVSTTVAVLMATKNNLVEQASKELQVGVRVFMQLLQTRTTQLVNSVQVLIADFGFREAVATEDVPTIQSALINYGSRVNADVALLIDLDGNISASTQPEIAVGRAFPNPGMLRSQPLPGGMEVVILNGMPYQVVIVPVRAPVTVAWVCMGFLIDSQLADELKGITKLDVSFMGRTDAVAMPYLVSTLPDLQRTALATVVTRDDMQLRRDRNTELDGLPYVTHVVDLAIGSSYQVTAYLQGSMHAALMPYRSLELKLIILTGGALLLTLITAGLIARSIIRPVDALVEAASRIEEGVYNQPISVSGRDELGQLAKTLNRMQHGISSRERRIAHQTYHDELTNLPNRAMLKDRFEMALARAERAHNTFAILQIDLDRFKEINDTLGPQCGDEVLQIVAQRLLNAVRNTDTVVRLGGDEFLVLLEDVTRQQALTLAGTIHKNLHDKFSLRDMPLKLSASIGVSMYPEHGDEPSVLMRRASIAMHTAKRGRLGTAVYKQGQDEEHLRKIVLIKDLESALHTEQFYLCYQPKVDIRTGQVTQLEALLRWKHPTHGFIPPDEFIGLAEESGHIHGLTQLVVRTAIRQIRSWLDQGVELTVAVNLSALDLMNVNLASMISTSLKNAAVDPRLLILEITESTVVHDAMHAIQVLKQLREIGLHLAIDDYGTGHSSLAQLKRMPFDELKIDKSFVLNLDKSQDDAMIVKSTIDLAHNMGLSVISEGVETKESWQLLAEYGCDLAQGYYISRPMPVAEVANWVKKHNAESQGATSRVLFGRFRGTT